MTTTPSTDLDRVAQACIEVAHRIVWATVATVDTNGRPATRILHPIWEFDGDALTGWIATTPGSPKSRHLDQTPFVSITYWDAEHDVATIDGQAVWEVSSGDRHRAWRRFADAPEPVGYDPSMIPGWTDPDADAFGVLRIEPTKVRVFPGSLLLRGEGDLLTWKR